ncbi:MAG TPA: zf-HC2 domain-containing protein [Pyrinomonadaceae bacterium]|nr:zf-HC2 domain-containing protein [Pyrinomonadaceae bacterium]
MTRCLDEAKLQSYFDGELSLNMMESVTSHLASCVTCAAAARELEEESALVMSALAAEFETSVPTERLRERIDAAVLGDRLAVAEVAQKTPGLAAFFSGLLNFGTQRTLGYASLAVVMAFAAIFVVVKLKSTPDTSVVNNTQPQQTVAVVNQPAETGSKAPSPVSTEPTEIPAPQKATSGNATKGKYQQVKYTQSAAPKQAPVKLLPGERSYLQTIARLDSTIKSNQKSMRPSLQVEYQRNLAVVDRAIAATRSAAKSNPNDPDAADFMFSAYQSKVDLLNTIADARLGGGRGH